MDTGLEKRLRGYSHPKFNESTPLGKLRKALNLSMKKLASAIGVSCHVIYVYENSKLPNLNYGYILRIYEYAKHVGIELDPSLIEEADVAYKEIVFKKKGIYDRNIRGDGKGIPIRSVDRFDREPITPIQALRFQLQIRFSDWIKLIDLSYNQALSYERGNSVVPIDLGKRMQEEARRMGVAVTLDELYQNVVPRGMDADSFEQE